MKMKYIGTQPKELETGNSSSALLTLDSQRKLAIQKESETVLQRLGRKLKWLMTSFTR
jgi:hypothetical protein